VKSRRAVFGYRWDVTDAELAAYLAKHATTLRRAVVMLSGAAQRCGTSRAATALQQPLA
jgi:hypothetical protein